MTSGCGPAECYVCKKTFSDERYLRRHLKRVHSQPQEQVTRTVLNPTSTSIRSYYSMVSLTGAPNNETSRYPAVLVLQAIPFIRTYRCPVFLRTKLSLLFIRPFTPVNEYGQITNHAETEWIFFLDDVIRVFELFDNVL